MENSGLLSAEDNLFGRVALYNKLATADQISECTRLMFVGAVGNGPQRSLADMMVASGHLSARTAGAITEAVRKKLSAAPAGAAAARPAQKSAPVATVSQPAVPHPKRARPGDSQVLVKVEGGSGPKGERIWVAVADALDSVTVKVCCTHLYPNDARAMGAACDRLLALGKSNMTVDMRNVAGAPSVILGEIARAGSEALERGQRLTLLTNKKVAAVAEMIAGKLVNVVAS